MWAGFRTFPQIAHGALRRLLLAMACLVAATGCEPPSERIVVVDLDVYDPYPFLQAEELGETAASETMWQARLTVAECLVTARFEARAREYQQFLHTSASITAEYKPDAQLPVRLPRRININTATNDELQQLPRVGPATSARIIAARPYRSVSDLLRVRGIGPRTLDQLRALITVASSESMNSE
jgi:DNA uptake protein ComE-like DNA-binding protein